MGIIISNAKQINVSEAGGNTIKITPSAVQQVGISASGNSGTIDVNPSMGTTNYNALSNKPVINNVTVTGNLNGHDLKLRNLDDLIDYNLEVENRPQINNIELIGDKTASDLKLMAEGDVEEMTNADIEKILSGMIL